MRCRPYRQKCVHADETKYVHCVAVVALCDLAEPADSLLRAGNQNELIPSRYSEGFPAARPNSHS
jgi:hypothetical protein